MKSYSKMNHQKYVRMALIGLSFLAVACSNEFSATAEQEETQEVALNIQANIKTETDDASPTRAGGNYTIPLGYRLRCILEIYVEGLEKPVFSSKVYIDRTGAGNELKKGIEFKELHIPAGNTYRAVCWADYIPADQKGDFFYKTSENLTNVSLITTGFSNDIISGLTANSGNNAEDAYCGKSQKFSITGDGVIMVKDEEVDAVPAITLARPFLKLQIPSVRLTDENGNNINGSLTNVRIKYDASTSLYTSYNVLKGTAGTETTGIVYSPFVKAVDNAADLFSLHHYVLLPLQANMTEALPVSFDIIATQNNGVSYTYRHGVEGVKVELHAPNAWVVLRGENATAPDVYPLVFKRQVP